MASVSFSLNPSCNPDIWLLWISPQRLGAASIDSSNRYIKKIGYYPFDPYQPDSIQSIARDFLIEKSNFRKIRVAWRMDRWSWVPTDECQSTDPVEKWITPFFSDRIGHTWLADGQNMADATAWVEVPDQLLEQLQKLEIPIEHRHATGFSKPSRSGDQLELTRLGNRCWFSLWKNDKFTYGQPHIIETPDDLLYIVSTLFQKFNTHSSRTQLSLVGEWEQNDSWLKCLQQHFKVIKGRKCSLITKGINVPSHWFTPLADLLLCE